MNASMQFVLHLEILKIVGGWAWAWSSESEPRKSEFELVYLIVVIFHMKSKFNIVGDHF